MQPRLVQLVGLFPQLDVDSRFLILQTIARSRIAYIEVQLKGIQNQDTLIDERFFSQQSMAEIVNQALEYYPFRQDQRALVHWLADKDFMFQGEPHLMRNVLYNLIKNALYFIQEADRGEIFISLESDDTFHYLYFKDTAMGMSPEVVEKVFDKFYSQSRHGTGLGLSFCKYVIEAFKGNITCQSKDGEYAQFILRFPHIK